VVCSRAGLKKHVINACGEFFCGYLQRAGPSDYTNRHCWSRVTFSRRFPVDIFTVESFAKRAGVSIRKARRLVQFLVGTGQMVPAGVLRVGRVGRPATLFVAWPRTPA